MSIYPLYYLCIMAIRVVVFSNGEYKIKKKIKKDSDGYTNSQNSIISLEYVDF